MKGFLEQYGMAILVVIAIGYLIFGVTPITDSIKETVKNKVVTEKNTSGDFIYVGYKEETKELIFSDNEEDIKTCNKKYGDINAKSKNWTASNDIAWANQSKSVEAVLFKTEIRPVNTAYWFYNFVNLKKFVSIHNGSYVNNLINLNTTNVTNMGYMFYNCGYNYLTKLDLENNFNTYNVINMSNMFNGCGYKLLEEIKFGNTFNTRNVEDMSGMFKNFGNESLTTLLLPESFDTSKVKDMKDMFNSCGYNKMTSLDLGSGFNTILVGDDTSTFKIGSMDYMFYNCGCISLKELNLQNFNPNIFIKENNKYASIFDAINPYAIFYVNNEEVREWILELPEEYKPKVDEEDGDGWYLKNNNSHLVKLEFNTGNNIRFSDYTISYTESNKSTEEITTENVSEEETTTEVEIEEIIEDSISLNLIIQYNVTDVERINISHSSGATELVGSVIDKNKIRVQKEDGYNYVLVELNFDIDTNFNQNFTYTVEIEKVNGETLSSSPITLNMLDVIYNTYDNLLMRNTIAHNFLYNKVLSKYYPTMDKVVYSKTEEIY